MDNNLLNAYSSIVSSETKIKILLALNERVLTPKKISELTKKRINHISMYLTQLKTTNLIVCLNENSKKGRLYKLTDLGNKVLDELKINGYSLNPLK